jgi:hypothetical protein
MAAGVIRQAIGEEEKAKGKSQKAKVKSGRVGSMLIATL